MIVYECFNLVVCSRLIDSHAFYLNTIFFFNFSLLGTDKLTKRLKLKPTRRKLNFHFANKIIHKVIVIGYLNHVIVSHNHPEENFEI